MKVQILGTGGARCKTLAAKRLTAVKIYRRVEGEQEAQYQRALLHAYRNFRSGIRPEN